MYIIIILIVFDQCLLYCTQNLRGYVEVYCMYIIIILIVFDQCLLYCTQNLRGYVEVYCMYIIIILIVEPHTAKTIL